METLTVRLVGTAGTIPHNGQMSNPMNEFSKALKAISGKKKKQEEDFEAMAKIEFLGSFYLTQDGAPGWPGENVESMLIAAAKKQKEGPQAKMSIFVDGVLPIIYKGPKTPTELWPLEEFRICTSVKVQMSRVMRTRPIFRQWELLVPIQYDPSLVDKVNVMRWVEIAGQQIGLSDWRPRYGRFTASEI